MRNLEQKVRESPQRLDVELDLVKVEYLFERFDFFQKQNHRFYLRNTNIKLATTNLHQLK